jgi:hypothetical protein
MSSSQEVSEQLKPNTTANWKLYPYVYPVRPDIDSPLILEDGTEIVLAETKNMEYAIIPVTVENGKPLLYSCKIDWLFGKDSQLEIDVGDFPILARTGLHDENQLDRKDRITGISVAAINAIGRPDGFSYAGFMAEDEDVIAVLKGDNRLVRAMGLTHPQLAKTLFHIWNIVLKEIELGNWDRFYDHIRFVYYKGYKISFKADGSKGWQVSIFQDEVQGSFSLDINRELLPEEKAYLENKYTHLTAFQLAELESKITTVHFSEMLPFYIMRYGFYEGHTAYRCDPVALAFIFGLKSLKEIDHDLGENLHAIVTTHYTSR